MCGITALINKNNFNISILISSLEQLQNRGYDSLGIGYINNNSLETYKKIKPDDFHIIHEECKQLLSPIYIGHTRWATHGGITLNNTHPHISFNKKFLLVHNGIIENYNKIKNNLINEKYDFYSETDTEVIVNLLEFHYLKNNNILESIKNTINELEGTYGIALISIDNPDNIYLFKKGSPLLISYNENYIMATSEIAGFTNLFNNYFTLENNQICILNKNNNFTTLDITLNKINNNSFKNIDNNNYLTNIPEPYKYWTEKEIFEQKFSLIRSINHGARINNNIVKFGGLENILSFVKKHNERHLIILGCGTSYNAGILSLHYFKQYRTFSSYQCFDGAEFEEHDIPTSGETYVIFCSQSGETFDLIRCIDIVKNNNCISIGVINVVDSTIARAVHCGIYLNAGREVAVASTKSFTSMIMILKLISIWFYQQNNTKLINVPEDLSNIRNTIYSIENILSNNKYNDILDNLDNQHLFVLGKGKLEHISKEAALKIKETCYIHAEGYSGSALKHGPFALLQKNTPVILLINHKYKSKMLNAYEEIKSREAFCLIITNIPDLHTDNTIYIKCAENYEEIPFIILLQLIAFKLSIKKGINPDKPRNLAKVVTVE
tara:strand:+ start:1721 stop:3550 length:1830 start_codon:yes stop_codon:yes gene_type:complete